jgi:hypothetical protein
MKRFLILFFVLGVIAASTAVAEAKGTEPKRVERTVEAAYGPYPAPVTGCSEPLGSFACMIVQTRTSESYFTAKVTDAHGQPVFVEVKGGTRARFCGETEEPIRFQPGSSLEFHLALENHPGEIGLDCPVNRIKSTGKIRITFSNLPSKEPVRSGSILTGTGWLLDGVVGGCQMAPECAAWLNTHCEQALAGQDPALSASIVDVGELADGPRTERVFRFGGGDSGLAWGGVQLQFWSSDCVELPRTRWRSTDCHGDGAGVDCSELRFRMPADAQWMTVTGYQDNVHLAWTLT